VADGAAERALAIDLDGLDRVGDGMKAPASVERAAACALGRARLVEPLAPEGRVYSSAALLVRPSTPCLEAW
jgi:hypothetical protein